MPNKEKGAETKSPQKLTDKLQVIIVNLDTTLFEGEADSLILPGKGGIDLGVLPFHTPLYAALFKGDIKVNIGSDVKPFPIDHGVAKIINNKVTILIGF
jgi:F0F1-type ATP synthase epsilon subunit